MTDLISTYKKILKTAGLISDKNGLISAEVNGSTVPYTVGGKRLVLPTRENMMNVSESCVFHPLQENILKGESAVLSKFRRAINIRLNLVLGSLIGELLTLITSVGDHQKLTPDQSELLSVAPNADEETLKRFKDILKAMPLGNVEKCIVNIYLKSGGVITVSYTHLTLPTNREV